MKDVMQVVRKTSLFFQPQIRTKIMNEGWASYWHQYLFLKDDRIYGHEVDYSRVNAYVTSLPRVGLNPYALGMRLFEHLEDMANKGRLSLEFQRIKGIRERERYEKPLGQGKRFIFQVREDYCDFTFINQFVEQDFVDRHRLFVSGKKLNRQRRTWQYYIKSRQAEDYKQMLIDALYHPPVIRIDQAKGENGKLYLDHRFEGKPLVSDFIAGTMLGIEFLWGAPVQLETSEVAPIAPDLLEKAHAANQAADPDPDKIKWQRVLYTMSNKKLTRAILE
jgi:stage V sporulation protein R